MVVELVSSRIVAPIIGASVFTWTSVIGLTLLGLALGGWIGGKLADTVHNNKLLPIAFLLSAVLIALIPKLAEHTDFITNASSSILNLNLLLSIYLFLLPACAIGTIQPILLKKYADDFSLIGSKYGVLSATWSIGSMCGVFLTGFFFISTIGSKETLWVIASLLFILGGVFAWRERTLHTLFLLSLIIVPSLFFLEQKADIQKVLFKNETNYYSAKVVDANIPSFGKSRILFLDFDAHSIESTKFNPYLYTEIHPLFSYLHSRIQNILVIGAGAYVLPKHFSDYYPNAHVDVIETDPELIAIGNAYFDLTKYDIDTLVGDAKIILKKDPQKYDVIFGDAYNSFISVPWYLLTKEWNDGVREKLTQDGVYAINFVGSVNGEGKEFTKSVANTFKLSFPNFYVFSFGEQTSGVQNIMLVGMNGGAPTDEAGLLKKISRGNHSWMSARLVPSHLVLDSQAIILTDNFSPVEHLMEPLVKKYFSVNQAFMKTFMQKYSI